MKEKAKSKSSTLKNFVYSLKIILSVDKRIPVLQFLLLLSSLALSLYSAYENKFFLDALGGKQEVDALVLIFFGIAGLNLLIGFPRYTHYYFFSFISSTMILSYTLMANGLFWVIKLK